VGVWSNSLEEFSVKYLHEIGSFFLDYLRNKLITNMSGLRFKTLECAPLRILYSIPSVPILTG